MLKKIMFASVLFFSTLNASLVNWEKDFQSGLNAAKQKNKPLMFVFSRHTCHYCNVLDEETFQEEEVAEELNKNFVSVVAYTDDGDYVPRQLWRPGTPAIWFLMPDGEPMFKPLMGAVGPGHFLQALEKVKEEFSILNKK